MEALSASATPPPPNLSLLRPNPRRLSAIPCLSSDRFPYRLSLSKSRLEFSCSSVVVENQRQPDVPRTPISTASPPLKCVSADSLQYETGFLGAVPERTGEPVSKSYLTDI